MNMTTHTLPIHDALREGWTKTRANLRPLAYLGALNLLLAYAQQTTLSPETGQTTRPMLALALQICQVGVWLVYVRWALALCDGAAITNLTDGKHLHGFLPFLATALLYGLIVGFGLVLLIIPGIIWALRFAFATSLVVDRDLDPWAALQESARLTRGVKSSLLGFGLLCLLLNVLGGCLMGLGLIVTVPMTLIAQARLLRHLQLRVKDECAPPATVSTPLPA